MKARAALSKVLANPTLAKKDLFEKSLEIARIHKMGTTSLRKLTKDLFDAESSAESVEDAEENLWSRHSFHFSDRQNWKKKTSSMPRPAKNNR